MPYLNQSNLYLRLSQRDYLCYCVLRDARIAPESVFFFAQQSIEKALGAVLYAHGLKPLKTHSLKWRVRALNRLGLECPIGVRCIHKLSSYGDINRYRYVPEEHILPMSEVERLLSDVRGWVDSVL